MHSDLDESVCEEIDEIAANINNLFRNRNKTTTIHELKQLIIGISSFYSRSGISDERLSQTSWPMEGITASKKVLECFTRYEEAIAESKKCVSGGAKIDPDVLLNNLAELLDTFRDVHGMQEEMDKDEAGISIDLQIPILIKVVKPIGGVLLQKISDAKEQMFQSGLDLAASLQYQERIQKVLENQIIPVSILEIRFPANLEYGQQQNYGSETAISNESASATASATASASAGGGKPISSSGETFQPFALDQQPLQPNAPAHAYVFPNVTSPSSPSIWPEPKHPMVVQQQPNTTTTQKQQVPHDGVNHYTNSISPVTREDPIADTILTPSLRAQFLGEEGDRGMGGLDNQHGLQTQEEVAEMPLIRREDAQAVEDMRVTTTSLPASKQRGPHHSMEDTLLSHTHGDAIINSGTNLRVTSAAFEETRDVRTVPPPMLPEFGLSQSQGGDGGHEVDFGADKDIDYTNASEEKQKEIIKISPAASSDGSADAGEKDEKDDEEGSQMPKRRTSALRRLEAAGFLKSYLKEQGTVFQEETPAPNGVTEIDPEGKGKDDASSRPGPTPNQHPHPRDPGMDEPSTTATGMDITFDPSAASDARARIPRVEPTSKKDDEDENERSPLKTIIDSPSERDSAYCEVSSSTPVPVSLSSPVALGAPTNTTHPPSVEQQQQIPEQHQQQQIPEEQQEQKIQEQHQQPYLSEEQQQKILEQQQKKILEQQLELKILEQQQQEQKILEQQLQQQQKILEQQHYTIAHQQQQQQLQQAPYENQHLNGEDQNPGVLRLYSQMIEQNLHPQPAGVGVRVESGDRKEYSPGLPWTGVRAESGARNENGFAAAGDCVDVVVNTTTKSQTSTNDVAKCRQKEYTQFQQQQHQQGQHHQQQQQQQPQHAYPEGSPEAYDRSASMPSSTVWKVIQNGDCDSLMTLIKKGLAHPSLRDAENHSILWKALQGGHARMGVMLLDQFGRWDWAELSQSRQTLLHLVLLMKPFGVESSECFRKICEHFIRRPDLFYALDDRKQSFFYVAACEFNLWVLQYVILNFFEACVPLIKNGGFLPLRYRLKPPAFRQSPAAFPESLKFPKHFNLGKMLNPGQNNKPDFYDICFDVGANRYARFCSHAVVVCSQSSTINEMAIRGAEKTPEGYPLIHLDQRISKSVWKLVLQFMYTGEVFPVHLDEPRKSFELIVACVKYKLVDALLHYAVAHAETQRNVEALSFGLSIHRENPEAFSTTLAETCAYLVLLDTELTANVSKNEYLEAINIMESRYVQRSRNT